MGFTGEHRLMFICKKNFLVCFEFTAKVYKRTNAWTARTGRTEVQLPREPGPGTAGLPNCCGRD